MDQILKYETNRDEYQVMLLKVKKSTLRLELGRYSQASCSICKTVRVLVVSYMLASNNSSHD